MIALERVGHLDQVVLVTDRPAIDARPFGGIALRIHPKRGLDLGAAWYRGLPLAWIGPAGEGGAREDGWRDSWGGGLVTTCGLDNVGAPSEGIGLHGTFTFLAAQDVRLEHSPEDVVVRGTLDDPRGLRVLRTIRTAAGRGRVQLVDRTTNSSDRALEAPVLYHVNLGWPLWDTGVRVETDATRVQARDDEAAAHDWSTAPAEPAALPERVWEHVGATGADVVNERLGVRVGVASNLPRLWEWVDPAPGVYALGIEPANCSVLGRAHDRAAGTLPFLEPGEERTTTIEITAEEVR